METSRANPVELLRLVLEGLRDPITLNDHPWAISASPSGSPESGGQEGEALIQRVTEVFRKMIPPTPPRSGKRLDTRWGAFGLLAARYFAPLLRGMSFPSSLQEAWEGSGEAILWFVYGRVEGLTGEERNPYRLAGDELGPAPNSTLSDWHRKGLKQLAELVNSEQSRSGSSPRPAPLRRTRRAWVGVALGLGVALIIALIGSKVWNLYRRLQGIELKVKTLETYLGAAPSAQEIPEIARNVHEARLQIDSLQQEAQPYLWMTPYLGWIPNYGGTISQARPLLALAQNLASAADEGLTAITPAAETALSNSAPLEVMDLVTKLQAASPELLNAQISLAQAEDARKQIEAQRLVPRLRNILTGKIDPLLSYLASSFPMQDALTMVRIAPKLLGGDQAGPQTYLILLQNEDELRPTGGYLTAAGTAVVMNGKLLSIRIESSELADDLSKPYPRPPWQFEQFMNIRMFLLRDSNWFTDFPTTASWSEYFYSYTQGSSANGTIAMDMHVIVRLWELLGPIHVNNVSYPITSENVLGYMRSAEQAPPKGLTGKWDRKQFISDLARPLLDELLSARGETWSKLMPTLVELLNEKHILLQMDDPDMAAFLERKGWDGAVRIPRSSDFLMAVDTNMGYNKSNAVLDTSLAYSVDLTNTLNPGASLEVTESNRSTADLPCEPFSTGRLVMKPTQPGQVPELYYNIDECHWGYLRVYMPQGTRLLYSNPHDIPAESTMLGEMIPARTDNLGNEDIPGAQVFGTMVLTPNRQVTTTEFDYALPQTVLTPDAGNNSWTYRLKVQKQPGTIAEPLTLALRLPRGTVIKEASVPFSEKDGAWTAQLSLQYDLTVDVRFGTN